MRSTLRDARNIFVVAVLIAVVIAVAITFTGGGCGTELCCPDCDMLTVTRVIDGDTFVSPKGRVRLYGVDTPEVGERCADEATDRLKDLAGTVVRVEPGPRATDRYGRLLYYVYTEDGESVDERLIRDGLARAWTRDGQHVRFLMGLQKKAQTGGKGCLF